MSSIPTPGKAEDKALNIFKNNNFRHYQIARLCGVLGIQMEAIANGWQIYEITGRAIDLGWVGLSIFIPSFLLSFVGGDVADRYDRRKILLWTNILHLTASILLLLLTYFHSRNPLHFYPVIGLLGVARAFGGPAGSAILPSLVPPHELQRAIGFNSTIWQLATILGPAIGGAIYAAGNGAIAVYGTSTVMALIAILSIWRISGLEQTLTHAQTRFIDRLKEGIAFIKNKPIILGAISLDLFAVLLGGATALLPIYARDILQTGPNGLGILRSAPAVGATLMALVMAYRPMHSKAGIKMLWAVFGFGVFTCIFALSKSFALSVICLAAIGALDMVSVVVRQTLIQLNTPQQMRGRVSAVSMVFIVTSNELGEVESGLTAHWFGTVEAALLGGIGSIAIVFIWAYLFPALKNADSLQISKVGSVT